MRRLLCLLLLACPAALALAAPPRADRPAAAAPAVGATVGGPVSPAGEPIRCYLPPELHMKNTGGNDRTPENPRGEPGKGYGLCVFTSIEMAARLQGLAEIDGLQEWMTHRPGGGYPSKVDAVLKEFCASRGVAVPPYVQSEGLDVDLVRRAVAAGRMPCITYSWSFTGRYRGSIAHMVCCPHGDRLHFGILDNNFPGSLAKPNVIEWLSEAEFVKTHAPPDPRTGRPTGWVFVWLPNPQPPRPCDAP